jgi:hypothetical protein
VVGQADGPPVFGRLDTARWPVGALVADERRLSIPAYTPPGDYALLVGLYDRATLRRLGEGGADRARLGPLALARGPAAPGAIPRRLDAGLGGVARLVGYELTGAAQPGRALQVDLLWQAEAPLADDLTVFVHLLDTRGERRAQDDARPAKGSYPTTTWAPGEIVRDRHTVAIPADAPPGQYRIVAGLYDAASGRRLGHKQWPWSREESAVRVVEITVAP